jgi:secondary thiamine-phosphate synthase enzyme
MVFQKSIQLQTSHHRQMHDLTGQVAELVAASGVQNGLVNLFNVGSTAALGTIEYEPGLVQDLPDMLDRLIPPGQDYDHEQAWHDGNGHSHLQATLLGPSLTVPIQSGQLVLGTWQQIFHLECDIKPRSDPSSSPFTESNRHGFESFNRTGQIQRHADRRPGGAGNFRWLAP